MSVRVATLVVAGDAAAAASIPGADGALVERLLVSRAVSWGERVAPGRSIVLDGMMSDQIRGERIAAAASEALAIFGAPLLIVSAAFPALGAAHERAACDDLDRGCDVTVGPSTSGDWFLLGLGSAQLALLEALAGRDGRGGSTLMAAAARGELQIGMLRSERPLRTLADADALRADPLAAPELVAALGRRPNTI